jgi:hypothetical protein
MIEEYIQLVDELACLLEEYADYCEDIIAHSLLCDGRHGLDEKIATPIDSP